MSSRDSRIFFKAVLVAAIVSGASLVGGDGRAEWVEFVDETALRLVASDELVALDDREKDYAWGDVDQDGDVDLIVVRKEPWVSLGKNRNVLLLNENGVLVDRTADFATLSDVAGDQGFLTPTNDRDVVLVDVDLDGWLDIVTATTMSPDDDKAVGHPRVYRNQGCSEPCEGTEDWLGFRYEEARIPAMLSHSGQAGFNPNFCAVAAADVTGDDYPDLWFADYDADSGSGPDDFNDKLLVNQGAENPGFFQDVTAERFSGLVPGFGPFEVSAFGAAGAIADINGDSKNDVVRQDPEWVGAAINSSTGDGFFDTYAVAHTGTSYFVSVDDLNQDDKLDMVLTDDGADRYLINMGNFDDIPNFISAVFSFSHSGVGGSAGDDGFGDNNLIVDLDKDGWKDVLIADVDVRVTGCSRRMHIYRNLGGQVGSIVDLQEQTSGTGCENFWGNPDTCIVAGIPSDRLEGTHDVAMFDINGDTWPDLVVGRCSGTEIYVNQPPGGAAGAVPDGQAVPGAQLTLDKAGSQISLAWGASCSAEDSDYAVYEGVLGSDFTNHVQTTCSTGGATSYEFEPGTGNTYYLVVPGNGAFEGSYGLASNGAPRQPGTSACAPMNAGVCE